MLKAAVILVATALVVAGGAYGYLRYRFGQIRFVQCPNCTAVAGGAPFNVLLVGADTRQGVPEAHSGGAFEGSADSVKILHVDPAKGSASILSMSYDTYVPLSGMPRGTDLATDNKITSAFEAGVGPVIQTVENTFGIPLSHFVVTDFGGLTDLVDSVGGINLAFPYPVRDDNNGTNMTGLTIPKAGCQTLNGTMALALARARYYEYEVSPGNWQSDATGDLGRLQRQNSVIEGVINKAESSYNPLTINAFVGSLVHDFTVDSAMSSGTMISLAERYHAFSGSSLKTYTLPTYGAWSSVAGNIEVVQEPQAQQVIAEFLGGAPNTPVTPPVNAAGTPLEVPAASPPPRAPGPSGTSTPAPSPTPAPAPGGRPFDPAPC